jgi:hypothetical protein
MKTKNLFIWVVANATAMSLFLMVASLLGGHLPHQYTWVGAWFRLFLVVLTGAVIALEIHQRIDYSLWKLIEDEESSFGWDHNKIANFIHSLRGWVGLVFVVIITVVGIIITLVLVNEIMSPNVYWIQTLPLYLCGMIATVIFFVTSKGLVNYDHSIWYKAENKQQIEVA